MEKIEEKETIIFLTDDQVKEIEASSPDRKVVMINNRSGQKIQIVRTPAGSCLANIFYRMLKNPELLSQVNICPRPLQ